MFDGIYNAGSTVGLSAHLVLPLLRSHLFIVPAASGNAVPGHRASVCGDPLADFALCS